MADLLPRKGTKNFTPYRVFCAVSSDISPKNGFQNRVSGKVAIPHVYPIASYTIYNRGSVTKFRCIRLSINTRKMGLSWCLSFTSESVPWGELGVVYNENELHTHPLHASSTLVRFERFVVTTQVVLDCEATCGPSVCGIYFNTNHTNLTNCAGVNLQLGNNSIRVSLTRIFRILLIERGNDPTRIMKW